MRCPVHRVLLVIGWCRSWIQVVSFVWVLTIWYSLGLVLCWSSVLESALLPQRLRAWSPDGSCPDPGGHPHCQFWVPRKRVAGLDGSWILQPDLLILPLDFGVPTWGTSVTAFGQLRLARTSSGHRYWHGTQPIEQGPPHLMPSGWWLLGMHRKCLAGFFYDWVTRDIRHIFFYGYWSKNKIFSIIIQHWIRSIFPYCYTVFVIFIWMPAW